MNPTRVMIVEDNTTVAKDLEFSLTDFGYEVTSIQASGEEAIEKARLDKPDITIMDIHLRDSMTGIDAAQLIYDQFNIPVIFLSAFSDRSLLEKARSTGAFGYLVKPFHERELLATMEMALYKAKAEKKQREMEAQLAQMKKMESLRIMAASVAHNFNNILQIPIGYHDLIVQALPPDSPCLSFINDSHTAVKKAVDISKKMLLYVGHSKSVLQKIDVNKQALQAIDKFQDHLPEKHLLGTNLATVPTIINANADLLQDMIGNLLTNASEAIGDDSGEIVLSTHAISKQESFLEETFPDFEFVHDNYIMLKISDTGCGMDKDTLEKVFDPFFSTKFLGRGLGLATTLGIVNSHQGAIAIESQLKKGTRVKMLFPAF